MSKRLFTAFITFLILFSFNVMPANAATKGVGDVTNAMIYGPGAPIGTILDISNSDDSTRTIAAPFPINFFGTKYEGLCITTNGGVYPVATSTTSCSNQYDKNLQNLALTSDAPIIAALAADLDLRKDISDGTTTFSGGGGGGDDGFAIPTSMYQGTTTIDGRDAWVLTWYRVGFFSHYAPTYNGSVTFQIVLIKKDTSNGASAGYDFDIQFNYGTLTLASDGYLSTDPISECSPDTNNDPIAPDYKTCRWGVGWSNYIAGTPEIADPYELFASTPTSDLLDSNTTSGLVYNNLNSPNVPGRYTFSMVAGQTVGFRSPPMDGSSGEQSAPGFPWVGDQRITCPTPNPWVKEQLGFASNAKPVLVSAENTIGKTVTQSSYDSLKTSGVVFDTVSTKVSTATDTLPIYGCKDKLLNGKVNQPIQFIAGGYTLQSDAHGYINTADLKWHDTNSISLYTNTAAFMHTIKFTKKGKYVVVLTEQPDTSSGLIPTYGVRSVRFVINVN
jgi:hypothetical protein